MGIVHEVYPQCDICHETFPDFLTESNVKKVIEFFQNDGFHIFKVNKQWHVVCPDCQNKEESSDE